MNKIFKGITLIVLLLSSASVYALDGDFYVYEGFSQTVSAFKALSLIFHDHQFQVLAGVFATIGLFSGGFVSFMRAVFSGGQGVQSAIGWLFMPLLGCIIYQATVLPKGNIHIYDKVSNQHQTIGNIPNLLILVASSFNSIEEDIRGLVNKNSASPYSKEVNVVSLRLFYNVMMGAADTTSVHYGKSIRRFYDDCMPISNVIEPKFDLDRLLKDTPNIFDELQHLWHPSIFTVFYGDNKRGETLCCTKAWNKLSTWINDSGKFQNNFVKICKRQGFSEAKQIPACKQEIQKGASFLFGRRVSADMLFRNAVFAHNIAKSLTDDDPDIQVGAYSNRKIINSGLASATAAQTWMPGIKATVTAIVLSIMPFLLLLLVTPLITKTLILVFSLFAWLTLWGICDAILHQSAIDQMIAAFEEVRSFQMGLWALWEAPTAAIKGLAIIAQSRTMAATIAGMIGSAIFGFSAYAFGGVSSAFTSKVEHEGAAAADRTLEPERAADYMEGIARASAQSSAIREHGWNTYQGYHTQNTQRSLTEAQIRAEGSGGHREAGINAGSLAANADQGRLDAHRKTAVDTNSSLSDVAYQKAITEAHQQIAQATVTQENLQAIAIQQPGNSPTDNVNELARFNQAQTRAIIDSSQGDSQAWQQIVGQQTAENVAVTGQRKLAAEASGNTPEGLAGGRAYWDTLTNAAQLQTLSFLAPKVGMSQQQLAQAITRGGVINNLSLSSENIAAGVKNGLIPANIATMLPDGGVLNAVLGDGGRLQNIRLTNDTTASNTTTIDNSLNLGNAAAARSALTNVGQVENILRTKGNDTLYQASTDALKPIVSMTHQANLHAGMGVSAHMGMGVKAGGDIGKNWSDQTVTDALYGNFSALGKALQVEAVSQNIDIKDQPHWIAERYAQATAEVQAYYTQDSTKDSVSATSAWEAVKEGVSKAKNLDFSSSNPFEQYLKNQKLENAQKAFKAGVSAPEPGD